MEALVNNEISFSNVLVINSNGENLGIKSSSEALNIANSEGLDSLFSLNVLNIQ